MCYIQAQPIPVASFLYAYKPKEGRTKRMTQEENERQNMIRVVVCRPGERAEVTEIEDNLRSMQTVVGGLIQEYFPFHSEDDPRYDDLALIVNDEGKLMRMPPSRAVFDEDGHVQDVIAGPFFICYAPVESETFLSLPDDLAEEMWRKFDKPEMIYRTDEGIQVVRYMPEKDGREQER